jgi:hypothetical protein
LSIKHGNRKEEAAMAKEESEFQKLLNEAPAAPSTDTVTVMGALSRAADPSRFVLTLPDGRSETLEVAAVKSVKKIAGAVGQSLVELELDAKRVPEKISENLNKPLADHAPNTLWYQDTAQTIAYVDVHQTVAYYDHTGFKDIVGDAPPPTLIETIGAGGVEQPGYAPFAAAMPHQAHSHRAQSHLLKPPQFDPQVPPKQPSQDGTNPWNSNSFDISGFGGFDVITYHGGQPIYHY